MSKDEKTYPTWGYHQTEPARIFELGEDESLPKGWEDTPAAFADKPAKAKEEKPAKTAEDDAARLAAVTAKGAKAKEEGKERSIPPAYRGKPEEVAWLAGFDGPAV